MDACTRHLTAHDAAAPPIDLVALAELVDGDTAFEQELINDYLQCGRTSLEEILRAIGAEDLATVQHSAHSLKGASGNLHASVMCSLAEQLETAAKSGSSVTLAELADAVNSELQRTIEFLAKRAA